MPCFKEKLRDTDRKLSGAVCTIPSATVPQAIAASGADCIVVDLEHGAVDYGTAHAMIAATQGTECAALVRIAANEDWQVKRALDLGAERIVFPLVSSAAEVEWAVKSLRYPPEGTRGFGPFIAQSRWHTDLMSYQNDVEDRLTCIPLIETVEAVENIEAICAVDGLDCLMIAAFDLSTALGVSGQFTHPDFLTAVAKVEAAAAHANIPLGTVALAQEQAAGAFARGHRLIAGFDLIWLRAKTAEMVSWTQD